jgi:hypothetical protein
LKEEARKKLENTRHVPVSMIITVLSQVAVTMCKTFDSKTMALGVKPFLKRTEATVTERTREIEKERLYPFIRIAVSHFFDATTAHFPIDPISNVLITILPGVNTMTMSSITTVFTFVLVAAGKELGATAIGSIVTPQLQNREREAPSIKGHEHINERQISLTPT